MTELAKQVYESTKQNYEHNKNYTDFEPGETVGQFIDFGAHKKEFEDKEFKEKIAKGLSEIFELKVEFNFMGLNVTKA